MSEKRRDHRGRILHNGEIFKLKIARCKIEKHTPYFTPFADDIMRK